MDGELFDDRLLVADDISPPKKLHLEKGVFSMRSIKVFVDFGDRNVEVEVLRVMEGSCDEVDDKAKGGILVGREHNFHSAELNSPTNVFADRDFETY